MILLALWPALPGRVGAAFIAGDDDRPVFEIEAISPGKQMDGRSDNRQTLPGSEF